MSNTNSKHIGEVSESIILSKFLQAGFSVSIPFGNNQRYDLVLDYGNLLLKVQCKTARLANGCMLFYTCSKNGFTGERRSYTHDADLFAAYCPQLDKVYVIPVSDCPEIMCSMRITDPKVKYTARELKYARDYEFSTQLPSRITNFVEQVKPIAFSSAKGGASYA